MGAAVAYNHGVNLAACACSKDVMLLSSALLSSLFPCLLPYSSMVTRVMVSPSLF